jgi:hypothetical protein
VEDITYAWSKNLTDNYGLLGDILGVDEYDDLTNISMYVFPNEPASYDSNITHATPTHTRKQMKEEWYLVRTSWFIQKGFLRGVVDNLRDALNQQYYSQLRHRLTAYRNITPYQILEHLNNRWCPLDVKAKKELKTAYYMKWEHTVEHLTAFGKRLDDNQRALVQSDVTIADDDKIQFYLEEIYDSNRFNKQEMFTWEREPAATKTDFTLAKAHFKTMVNATDTYEQNAGGGTAGRNRYESANQMADYGDEIREYIQQLASASAANNTTNTAANIQTTNKLTTMEAEIKKITTTITSMANKLNSNPNPNPNGENINPNSGEIEGSQKNPYKKLWNMGEYCSSYGFHPVGIKHNSATCIYKKPEHKSEATWCNRLGGNMAWPSAKRVTVEQQEHPSWKGKTAPTN